MYRETVHGGCQNHCTLVFVCSPNQHYFSELDNAVATPVDSLVTKNCFEV